jgi:hypothetical protein
VEVKSLIKKRFIANLKYWFTHKKLKTDYVAQVQGEIWIAERDWVDVIFYNPAFRMLVVRVFRDDKFIKELQTQLMVVINKRDEYVELLKSEY